jgi:hypothetical protein
LGGVDCNGAHKEQKKGLVDGENISINRVIKLKLKSIAVT